MLIIKLLVETDSLRDPLLTLHDVFINIKDSYLKKAIMDISKKYVVDGKVNVKKFLQDLHNIIFDDDIELDKEDKKYLIKTIFNRALYLHNKFVNM